MDILRFDEKQLSKSLERLSPQLRVAFAAACAERLLPSYIRFSQRTGRGDPKRLQMVLGRLWRDLTGDLMGETELRNHIDACMKLIPAESDKPWVAEQPAAEDAATALVYALQCRENGGAQEATWAARRAYEALDDYVIRSEDVDTSTLGGEACVLSNALVQAEFKRQKRDLDELLQGMVAIDELKNRARAESADFLPMRS